MVHQNNEEEEKWNLNQGKERDMDGYRALEESLNKGYCLCVVFLYAIAFTGQVTRKKYSS